MLQNCSVDTCACIVSRRSHCSLLYISIFNCYCQVFSTWTVCLWSISHFHGLLVITFLDANANSNYNILHGFPNNVIVALLR